MDEARQGRPFAGGSERGLRLGQRLRAAREAKGTSIDAVHRATGVPAHYLKMFEEGRFPMVSDPAYLAPFLRRYATYLGLDSEQALRDLITENEPETAARRSGKGAISDGSIQAGAGAMRRAVSPAPLPAERPRGDGGSRPIGYGVGIVLAATAGVGGYVMLARNGQWPTVQRLTQLKTGFTASLEATMPTPAATNAPEVAAVPHESSSQFPAQIAERVAPTAPPPTAAPSPAPTPAPEPSPSQPVAQRFSPPYELSLTALRPVWIWVSIDGGPRRSLQLDPGRSVKWVAHQGYVLSVDDAGGVRAVLNGTALGTLGAESQARRNMIIPSPELLSVSDG